MTFLTRFISTIYSDFLRIIILFLCSFFFVSAISAQSINGQWYGVGKITRFGEESNYLSELILKQKGKKVTGEFNYYFKSVEIKTKITGTYDSEKRLFLLSSTPVLNYQAKNANGADCPMEGWFMLKVSRIETILSGQFSPVFDYRHTCPAINTRFVKSIGVPPVPAPGNIAEAEDTVPAPALVEAKKQEDPNQQFVSDLNKRIFDLNPVIDVDADSLKVAFYDNGEVDGDTISVFYNRKVVALKQMLSDKPLNFMLPLDTSINEIAMYAENMGRLPPNTAVAVIYAGEQRFELNMTSTFIKNAAIRFRRKVKVKVKDPKNIN